MKELVFTSWFNMIKKKTNYPVLNNFTENWQNEFARWSPSINVSVYYGSQDDRKYQRIQWSKHGFGDTEVILTT